MHITLRAGIYFVAMAFTGSGCRQASPRQRAHDKVADAITEEYAYLYVRPLSDPIAQLVHKGMEIPPELLKRNRVTLVEVTPQKGKGRTVFEDKGVQPLNDGMVTGVEHAHGIGLYYPATLSQPEVEVRVNYSNDFGDDGVAVHVVAPNPLLIAKRP
jgi:hypothetical protein